MPDRLSTPFNRALRGMDVAVAAGVGLTVAEPDPSPHAADQRSRPVWLAGSRQGQRLAAFANADAGFASSWTAVRAVHHAGAGTMAASPCRFMKIRRYIKARAGHSHVALGRVLR
jgi:hypothetical protein